MRFCSLNFQEVSYISPQERGFSYGDGHFTTARVSDGRIEFFDAHIARLKSGNQALYLGEVNWRELVTYLTDVARGFDDAVLKVVITAGDGYRGYARNGSNQPNIYVFVFDSPEFYKDWQLQGIAVGVAQFQLGLNPELAGIKHLNRLEQVLLRREIELRAEHDLIVANIKGEVVEAGCANVFWLKEGQWYTPEITNAGISGILRSAILMLMSDIEQVTVSVSDLTDITAMFVCNTVMNIVPVNEFCGKPLSIKPVHDVIKRFELHVSR